MNVSLGGIGIAVDFDSVEELVVNSNITLLSGMQLLSPGVLQLTGGGVNIFVLRRGIGIAKGFASCEAVSTISRSMLLSGKRSVSSWIPRATGVIVCWLERRESDSGKHAQQSVYRVLNRDARSFLARGEFRSSFKRSWAAWARAKDRVALRVRLESLFLSLYLKSIRKFLFVSQLRMSVGPRTAYAICILSVVPPER